MEEIKEEIKEEMPAAQEVAPVQETPIIDLQNVDVYQRKLLVLPKVTMSINRGEFVYLIGRTGSGKSSILKLLFADIPAVGEKADVAGYDLKKIKTRQIPYLRRKLGIVFQDYQLLSDMTVLDNLLFVMKATRWKKKNEMLNRAEEVLTLVGLETKDFKYPHQLSGGEQQRVCIARALLNKPEIILADEPTGNLDPFMAADIFQLLHDINKTQGTTVLMATHNFPMIDKFPSRTICIEDNKLLDSLV
ncbi:MAG: ATP-binding cassette domain-containing protein [Bacteroidales bacterium]|nr:ATP-binding cassette domain-containing protein [Bacteroidales bacterium]